MYEIADRPRNTQYLEKQKGDVEITFSKIDKARTILQFDPKVKIDEELKKTYEWQKENLN